MAQRPWTPWTDSHGGANVVRAQSLGETRFNEAPGDEADREVDKTTDGRDDGKVFEDSPWALSALLCFPRLRG